MFTVMNLQEITATVKKQLNITVCCRLLDTGKNEILTIDLYSNRKKTFEKLCSLGTLYAIRNGNEFKKPILTYKTFCKHLETKQRVTVYVASTGVFAGRYALQIIPIQ